MKKLRLIILLLPFYGFIRGNPIIEKFHPTELYIDEHNPKEMYNDLCSKIDPKTLIFSEKDLKSGMDNLRWFTNTLRSRNTYTPGKFQNEWIMSLTGYLILLIPSLTTLIAFIFLILSILFYNSPSVF